MKPIDLLEELYYLVPNETEDEPWWEDELSEAMEAAERVVEWGEPLDVDVVLRDLYTEVSKIRFDPYYEKEIVQLLKRIKNHYEQPTPLV